MKKIVLRFILICAFCVVFGFKKKSNVATFNIDRLMAKMTLKEKIGQMTQINIDLISKGEIYNLIEPHQLDTIKLKKAIEEYGVGSILNAGGHAYTLQHWQQLLTTIQNFSKKTRLKIPILYGIDAIHGANYLQEGTLFPQPLAQAASFNPNLVKKVAAITAYETKATGVCWNFSPVLDIGRQPLWSRMFETYGEDVLLAKSMGKSAINGYQDTTNNPHAFAACMKHFLGYSFPFTGKDRTSVYISDIQLREYFLPTFEEAIKNGAMSVMINSGDINGIPVHANKSILTALLRNELHFTGVAVTDWEDIYKLVSVHHVAANKKEAVKIAVNAGIDMSMVPNDYEFADLLLELVNEGSVSVKRINEAVKRILTMKEKLGLFKNPLPFATYDYNLTGSDSFKKESENIASECITLLKNNNNILPLNKNQRILIAGAAANNNLFLNGAWSRTWQGTSNIWDKNNKPTIFSTLKNYGAAVELFEGCEIDSFTKTQQEIIAATQNIDVIIFCVSEFPSTEKPGDIQSLQLSNAQIQAIKYFAKTGKPIVLLLCENRPLIVNDIEPFCDGIIMAYQPSENGVKPLVDIVFGKINPSGKLPITYPRFTNALLNYDHRFADEIGSTYLNDAFNPQWHFGHGLSYSKIEYSNLKVTVKKINKKNILQIQVTIKNTSNLDSKESVLVFVSDEVASIAPVVKKLRAFDKKLIPAHSSVAFEFIITQENLSFVNKDSKWVFEPGNFIVSVGNLSQKININ